MALRGPLRYRRVMDGRDLRGAGLAAKVVRVADVAVPLALFALAAAEIWGQEHSSPGIHGPRGLQTAGALVLTLPLVWRRTRPLVALPCVIAGGLAEWPWNRVYGQLSFPAFVAIVLAVYSVGAHTEVRRGVRALGLALIPLVAINVADSVAGYHAPLENAGAPVLLAVAWATGNAFRGRGARELELEGRAARLERERDESARVATGEERVRIARELHDVVAHSISLMLVQVGGAREIMGLEPETARVTLSSAEHTGREALAEMRRMVGILRHPGTDGALAPQPRLTDLGDLVEHAGAAGLAVDTRIEGAVTPLSPGVELAAYRIVQEALTNTVRHARGAAHARIHVRYEPHEVEVTIADDGAAPAGEPSGAPGHGLIGMRERVALYGGSLDAGRAEHGGFVVHARIPTAGDGP
jgi:signal transduction histidine kinase